MPQPWTENSELRLYQQALDQVELAHRLGIDYVWEVEHYFLEECSHSSAPEVFLAACSQGTKRIRFRALEGIDAHGTSPLAGGPQDKPGQDEARGPISSLIRRQNFPWTALRAAGGKRTDRACGASL